MNVIFFDIECACSVEKRGRIYSLGYAICDEHFQLLAHDDLLINPDSPWNEYVLKKILSYPRKIFDSKPLYREVYPQIRELFARCDYAVGFSIENDLSFLLDECDRYGLEPMNFAYADAQRMVRNALNADNYIGLEKAMEVLELPNDLHMHRSEDDALCTMRIAQALAQRMDTDLAGLIESQKAADLPCPALGRSEGYYFGWLGSENKDYHARKEAREEYIPITEENKNMILPHSRNLAEFRDFSRHAKPTRHLSHRLRHQKVMADSTYERCHFAECMMLVQNIVNEGGRYARTAREATIFLDYPSHNPDGSLFVSKRQLAVQEAIAQGARIRRLPLADFLAEMGWDPADFHL